MKLIIKSHFIVHKQSAVNFVKTSFKTFKCARIFYGGVELFSIIV